MTSKVNMKHFTKYNALYRFITRGSIDAQRAEEAGKLVRPGDGAATDGVCHDEGAR